MSDKLTTFDAARYLDSSVARTEFIRAALETSDMPYILHALATVAHASGMSRLAHDTGLARESLYKALGDNGNPQFDTILRIVEALGLRLSVEPARENDELVGAEG